MWDERYRSKEYAYGTQPNDFLHANVECLPKGRVLSLAEGEGRNAVFLAQQGYSVTAVDSSVVGIEKARKLAELHNVEIEFIQADLTNFKIETDDWDAIISIFCPLPPKVRREIHHQVSHGLKENGVYLLEAYTPDQIWHGTGGGNDVDVMQTAQSLRSELTGLSFSRLEEIERKVVEGTYHTGLASVVQAIGIKK